ncbi:kinase-like domain-containing protein [Annulohypoxylon stygium]|nr:kinase-like domain-containing protein [Annulohypoxylon stygium]
MSGSKVPLIKILASREFAEDSRFKYAKAQGEKWRREFRVKLPKLKYEKVLGHGGFGMVQLWSIRDEKGHPTSQQVALKFPIRELTPNRIIEAQNETRYIGSIFHGLEHTIQLVEVEQKTVKSHKDKLTNNPNVDSPILVMEALGVNLFQLITWVNESRLWYEQNVNKKKSVTEEVYNRHKLGYIPNRVLWLMFSCLLKGVVGMAYPPHDSNFYAPMNNNHLKNPTKEVIPPRGADNKIPEPSTLIHFDLDPQNVLVGDLDGDEHSKIPKLKIGDFGLMLRWGEGWSNRAKLQRIGRGKRYWLAPEQIDTNMVTDPKYHIGWELNVWAIGVIMFNLMTLQHPESRRGWETQRRFVRLPGRELIINTYGWWLLPPATNHALAGYDVRLRQLICRCMAHETYDRPSLSEIWEAIDAGLAYSSEREMENPQWVSDHTVGGPSYDPMKQPPLDTHELTAKFFQDYFADPPPKPDPYEGKWSDNTESFYDVEENLLGYNDPTDWDEGEFDYCIIL